MTFSQLGCAKPDFIHSDSYVLEHALMARRIFVPNETPDKTKLLAEFTHLAVGVDKQAVTVRTVDLRNRNRSIPKGGVEDSAWVYVRTQVFQTQFDI
jgi:hypothetical protein